MIRTNRFILKGFALLLVILSSCGSLYASDIKKKGNIIGSLKVIKGKSNKAFVERTFGEPDRKAANAAKEIWYYDDLKLDIAGKVDNVTYVIEFDNKGIISDDYMATISPKEK